MSGFLNGAFGLGPIPDPTPFAYAPLFGTGADGNVTLSSGVVSLTRDMQYANLTLNGTGSIVTNGYAISVLGTLDISAAPAGAIQNNGTPGGDTTSNAAGAAGTIPTANIYFTQAAGGKAGGLGAIAGQMAGNAATGLVRIAGGRAGAAGAGGASGTGVAGGLGGAASNATITAPPLTPAGIDTWLIYSASGTPAQFYPSDTAASGGSGGGDATNAGGGGGGSGSGGGFVRIRARFIQRGTNTTAGIITATGARGGNGASRPSGNAGGGGSGSGTPGGAVLILTQSLLGTQIPNAIDVSGGNSGTPGTGAGTGLGGNSGAGGGNGTILLMVLATSTTTFAASGNSIPGNTTSTPAAAPVTLGTVFTAPL